MEKKHQNQAANFHHGKNSPKWRENRKKKNTPGFARGKSMQEYGATSDRLTLVKFAGNISGDDVGPTRFYIGIIIRIPSD